MIRKRKSKNEKSSDCENHEKQSSDKSKNKNLVQKLSEHSERVDVSNFSSPTFNIHIHVPPYKMSSSKIYLPRIQPVVHLHFDGIANKLDMNQNKKSEESWCKTIENLLSVASPKFGDVKFHFNDKSGGRDFEKSNEPSRLSKTQCNDSSVNKGKGKEKTQLNASKRSKVVCETSDSASKQDLENTSNEMLLSKYNDSKLKKAVVVLTDICKSNTWKNVETHIVSDPDESQNQNTSPENKLDNNNENVEHERLIIKQEDLSFTSSPTFYKSHVFKDNLENESGYIKLEEIILNKSTTQDMLANNQNITALFEGCNFSEILNRFRAKCEQYEDNTEKTPGESYEICNDDVNEHYSNEATTGDTTFEENNCDSQYVPDENTSFKIIENNINVEKEKNSGRESDEETVEFEFPDMRYNKTGSKSDKVNYTSERHSRAEEAILDSGTLQFNSSFKISSDHEGSFEVTRTQSSHSVNVGDIDFQLQLVQKEMKKRSQESSGKNRKTMSKPKRKSDPDFVKSNKSPSPKKLKPSDKTPGKTSNFSTSSSSSSSTAFDYIPLNTSGSTRFAVAPLDKIQPYKMHAAKNFKQEMLFGNRVPRFSSSDKLRIYQMKQAARKSNNNRDKYNKTL